jgi:hypothetical protein
MLNTAAIYSNCELLTIQCTTAYKAHYFQPKKKLKKKLGSATCLWKRFTLTLFKVWILDTSKTMIIVVEQL